MISSLNGTVLVATGNTTVIDVGGVGFSVQVTPDHAASLRVGERALVLTALVVREDSLQLFGFAEAEQLEVFDLLTAVSGVGPKSAMGVLSALSPNDIATAVADENDSAFRAVSGIGPKTAKLIVLSLTGKLAAPRVNSPSPAAAGRSNTSDSVLVALVGLGWPEKAASEAIGQVLANTPEAKTETTQSLLRLTLAQLGPSRPQAKERA